MWLTGQMPQMRDGDARHLAEEAPLAELLEAAELDHVEARVGDLALVVQEEGDLRVALDAGDGVDDDALAHGRSF